MVYFRKEKEKEFWWRPGDYPTLWNKGCGRNEPL